MQHSRTKHIDIRHHFIRELVENKCIVLEHVGTNDQLVDLFTKPLDATRFHVLSRSIGICLVDWCGMEIDPIWVPQAKRANLHTCHMQKFDIHYAYLLIAWVFWLHIYLYDIFFNKCEPLLWLQSMTYLCSNMHFWTRRFT